MEYRALGTTGVQVSRLCLGTMAFGSEADEKESAAMFARARDAGINFFDTANVYGQGRSEETLGKLIAGSRDELVITTKVHFPTGGDVNARGLSRRHIALAVEASLRRLGTDRIDLYFAHGFDARTPIEDTLGAFDALVRQGKILYPAVSNWAAWQIATALGESDRGALARFRCVQPMYNLVKRQAEVEILPLAAHAGLGVMTYSPLGGGLLTGKYAGPEPAKAGRLVTNDMYRRRYGNPSEHESAARLASHARERGVDPAALAVAWVLSHPAVTAPILGARNAAQLEPSLAAVDIEIDETWRREIAGFSSEPPPATDRIEERAGVFYGKPTPR